jgi:uncharacterized protein YcbX
MIQVGRIREIVRYPVKSMAGAATESALLGLDGHARAVKTVVRVVKTVVRLNENNAGVYATVVRSGTIRVADRVGLSEPGVI